MTRTRTRHADGLTDEEVAKRIQQYVQGSTLADRHAAERTATALVEGEILRAALTAELRANGRLNDDKCRVFASLGSACARLRHALGVMHAAQPVDEDDFFAAPPAGDRGDDGDDDGDDDDRLDIASDDPAIAHELGTE
jgi:hypothetical protein